MAARHPGERGTRECWEAGCAQYECVTAADIDPIAVERSLRHERVRGHIFTPDEVVERDRRAAEAAKRGRRQWPPIGLVRR